MNRRNAPTQESKTPNPYVMALLTAALAGFFSVFGGYFVASLQARYAIDQKHLELRAQAYSAFLEKIDRIRSPAVAQILNIGSLADSVATDGEIQALGVLLRTNDTQVLYWQLNSDFNLLRVYGTSSVRQHCDDILKVLTLRHVDINWNNYPRPVQEYYNKWREIEEQEAREGVQYMEAKISAGERLMSVVIAKLFADLIVRLRTELSEPQSTRLLSWH